MRITIRPYKKNGVEDGLEADISCLVDGVRVRRRLKSPKSGKQQTKRWAERLVSDWQSRDLPVGQVVSRTPTLAQYCDEIVGHYESSDVRPGTLRVYKQYHTYLCRIAGKAPITSFGSRQLLDLRAKLPTTLSARTINEIMAYLRRILALAEVRGYEPIDIPKIKPIRLSDTEVDPYTIDEIEAILSGVALMPPRYELAVRLGCDAGMRAGEMLALRWQDIHPGKLWIRRSYDYVAKVIQSTKTGKHRSVPIVWGLAQALEKQPHRKGYVLFGEDAPGSYYRLRNLVMKAEEAAGLDPTGRVHRLRHTFATRLMMNNVPPQVVQELGGWSSLKMVTRYTHVLPSAAEDFIHRALGDGS